MDLLKQLEKLGAVHPGRAQYTAMDRYRDYRTVFLSTEQGQRVLQDILLKSGFYSTALKTEPLDPLRLAALEGSRTLSIAILNTAYQEPKARPARAVNVRPEDDT